MIEIQEITKYFDTFPALRQVSFSIPDEAVYGLVGTNGAGKTTFLRMAAGILKPEEGQILVDRQPVYENDHIKQKLFYLPDSPYYLFHATPRRMAAFYRRLYPDFDLEHCMELHEQFRLPLAKKLRTFSKGMKKQSAILCALCTNVPYLLCDEIFDGLDPLVRRQLCEILRQEKNFRPLTMVIASHNLQELTEICTHIGMLHQGGIRMAREFHPEEFREVTLEDLFLEKGGPLP